MDGQRHFHTDPIHLIVASLGVFVVAHAARAFVAAPLIRKGGKWATAGKVIGGFYSLPASASTVVGG